MSNKECEQKLSLLQQFIQQRDEFIKKSMQLQIQLQQTQGAIFACDQMIKKIQNNEQNSQKEKLDGKINKKKMEIKNEK